MNTIALIASIMLGLAFVVAGGSKLASGAAWPVQAAGLGAPRLMIPVLPWLELVIGAALIVQLGEPIPAVLAILLLIAFTLLIASRLHEGKRPECACFGAWSAKPIGPAHIARNVLLLMLGMLSLYV